MTSTFWWNPPEVLVEPTRANAARLARALAEFGYEELALQAESHFAKPERIATLGRPPVAIDILSSTAGISFRAAWTGRQKFLIDEHEVAFLGLKEFVATKRACGRTKDLLDLELLREAGLIPRARRAVDSKQVRGGAKPTRRKPH